MYSITSKTTSVVVEEDADFEDTRHAVCHAFGWADVPAYGDELDRLADEVCHGRYTSPLAWTTARDLGLRVQKI